MSSNQDLLTAAYHAFNTRNLPAALATMHAEVEWPNTMEGGYIQGHDGIRAYWSKQWNLVDPHVDPVQFTTDTNGRIAIEVHQVVKDLQGNLLEDLIVEHIYTINEGLIRRMEMGEDRIMASSASK